jgi:hypothetical protein
MSDDATSTTDRCYRTTRGRKYVVTQERQRLDPRQPCAMFLYEQLAATRQHLHHSSWRAVHSAQRSRLSRHMTSDLAAAVKAYSLGFLRTQGVRDEPVVWHPPADPVRGLQLPGGQIPRVDSRTVCAAVQKHGRLLGRAAAELGTSVDVVRHLLCEHAMDAEAPLSTESHARSRSAYRDAKKALSRERLLALYQEDGRTTRHLTAKLGHNKHTPGPLADHSRSI